MKLDSRRALVVRLIAAEVLARPGTGPLAPRHFPKPLARIAPAHPPLHRAEDGDPRDAPDPEPR